MIYNNYIIVCSQQCYRYIVFKVGQIMSDFDISDIQGDVQVEITDLDPEVDGSSATLSIQLLRFARKLPLFNDPRGRFTLLVYLICAVVLLCMKQPGLPVLPKQPSGNSLPGLQYSLARNPLSMSDTTLEKSITWMRSSNGQIIVVQTVPGNNMWHHCKVEHGYASHIYTHLTFVVCT